MSSLASYFLIKHVHNVALVIVVVVGALDVVVAVVDGVHDVLVCALVSRVAVVVVVVAVV